MNKNVKRLLGLGLSLGLLLTFGCVKEEPVENKLTLNSGLLESKLEKDDGLELNFKDFTLLTKDKNLKLEEGKVYSILSSEDQLLQYKEVPLTSDQPEEVKEEIPGQEKVSLEGLNLYSQYEFDINGDGEDEEISLYTSADIGLDGEFMWDDNQRWLLVVHGKDLDYVLIDKQIQLGNLEFFFYSQEDDFYITSVESSSANINIKEFEYDLEKDLFLLTKLYETEGNVNLLHKSR